MRATGRHSGKHRGFRIHRGQPRFAGVGYRDRRSVGRVALLLTLAAALVLGTVDLVRLAPAVWDCPSWAPAATPGCAPRAHRYPIEDYLTTTPGQAPVKYPEHADFLGLGDGTTPAEISAAFPPGSTHRVYPGHAGRHRESWTWEGVHYVAMVVEATGRTAGTYVYRDDDSPYYVAAPNNLLLGSTTIRGAIVWNGAVDRVAPHTTGSWYAEFSPAYAAVSSPTLYLAKAGSADPPAPHAGPPYRPDSAPCLAVLYLETAASPAQTGLGKVPPARAGETDSCR